MASLLGGTQWGTVTSTEAQRTEGGGCLCGMWNFLSWGHRTNYWLRWRILFSYWTQSGSIPSTVIGRPPSAEREELQLEFCLISLQDESKHVLIINNVLPHSVGPCITSLFVALSTSSCNCFLGGSSLPLPSCHTLIDSPPKSGGALGGHVTA